MKWCNPNLSQDNRMDDTGKDQARQPNGKFMPPVETRFNGSRPNKRNVNGRPRNFDKLRKLVQAIGIEPMLDRQGRPLLVDGKTITRIQAIMRQWASDPKHQRDFIEYGWGKVPQPIGLDVTSGGKPLDITLNWRTLPEDKDED